MKTQFRLFLIVLAVLVGCDDQPFDLPDGFVLPDGALPADVGPPDAAPDAAIEPDEGPLDNACGDDYAPDRPLWSQIVQPALDGGDAVPDYINISNNLNVMKSLQLLASIVTKMTERLESVRDFDLEETLNDVVDPGQIEGNCICAGCDAVGAAEEAWDNAQQLVDDLLNNLPNTLLDVLQDLLDSRVQMMIDSIEEALAEMQQAASDTADAIDDVVQTYLDDAVTAYNACAIGNGLPTLAPADTAAALTDALDTLQAEYDTTFQAVQQAIDAIRNADLQSMWNDVSGLIQTFSGVSSIEDIKGINWTEVSGTVDGLTTQIEAIMPDIEAAVTAVTSLYQNATDITARITDIVAAIQGNSAQSLIDAAGGPNACTGLIGPALNGMDTAIEGAVEQGFNQLLAAIQGVKDDAAAAVNGNGLANDAGELGMAAVQAQLITPLVDTMNGGLAGCHAYNKRGACEDYCADFGGVFLWFPNDVFKDPKKAAAASALFALKQLGWLDKIADFQMGNNAFTDALGGALSALGSVSTALANLQEILDNFLRHVDHYSEGYHLGAYDELRPDLHMCVGYAGHAAFAQMGGLGGDRVSIGARYSSHNLSKKHRVQFRTGGFAVSAFGHALSLAPTIELNTQIDGWKLWDAEKPFGIDFGVPAIQIADVNRYDVFHLVDGSALAEFDPDGDGQIPVGQFLVRDLYSTRFDAGNGVQAWPRPEAAHEAWERKSTAVISAGLNLVIDMERKRWDLPTITIIVGVLTATPYFELGAGVAWWHQTNRYRDRIFGSINQNLPPADQLDEAVWARDMHAFQADDLTADDGTTAYVEPEIGVDIFLGFNIWKVRFGIGANLGLSVKIEPGGFGGVLDLNSALVDTLIASNTPPEAPCEPVMAQDTVYTCTNALLKDAEGQPISEEEYLCEPSTTPNSCCALLGNQKICIDDWTGLKQSDCELLNARDKTFAEVRDLMAQIGADTLPGVQAVLNTLMNSDAGTFTLSSTWNAGQTCAQSDCETKYTTAYLNITAISECAKYGICTRPDGSVDYDLTQAECEQVGRNGCYAVYHDVEDGPQAQITIMPLMWLSNLINLAPGEDSAWAASNEAFAQGDAASFTNAQKCQEAGWCINFSYMGQEASGEAGFEPPLGVGDSELADYPIRYTGSVEDGDVCPGGIYNQGFVFPRRVNEIGIASSAGRYIPFEWFESPQPGNWAPYQCQTSMEETLTGWQGPGCSPLGVGYASACGCQTDAHCAGAESCVISAEGVGRCQLGDDTISCACDPADDTCDTGRICEDGACLKQCGSNTDCASPLECESGRCVHPYGVPSAEQVTYGMQNVEAPIHTIASYSLSDILFLARLKFGLFVEASFKLFGKAKVWRIVDFARAWDVGSTYKIWFQPGLEARYQSACASVLGEGMTNRYPVASTMSLSQVLGFPQNGNVAAGRQCLLAGGVCRYPEDPAERAALPPVSQPPEAFAALNAGSLDDFLIWCKDDMPDYVEDPAPNTDDDIISGVTDTWQFGQDVGLTIWAENQICVDGVIWSEWIGQLPQTMADAQCTYRDPLTNQTSTFPCQEINEQMMLAWGCLSADAPPGQPIFGMRLRDRFDGTAGRPDITYMHPDYGNVFDLDQMFDWVSVTYADGTTGMEFQYNASNMKPFIRFYNGSFPFFYPAIGERWLEQVEACVDARMNNPEENQCPCATDDDCALGAGEQCISGLCQSQSVTGETCDGQGSCTPQYSWAPAQCPIVSMQFEAGPCCGDGTVQVGGEYTEECDDGNTEDGDGCDAHCNREEAPRRCSTDGSGACINRCPQGQICDEDCGGCVDPVPGCETGAAGQCLDSCPAGQACDADCGACQPVVVECRRNPDGVCENNCPEGFECDRACGACVREGGAACQERDNVCEDGCPEGRVCDDDCRTCVAEVPECGLNAGGVCINNCPDGLRCDGDCKQCVGHDVVWKCQQQGLQCLDACPGELICDEGCRECVAPPAPCRADADGVCQGNCPDGQMCDADCSACVEVVPASCRREGDLCIDTCPRGQRCDADCGACAEIVPVPSCLRQGDLCVDACPRGQQCDADCGACVAVPLPSCRREGELCVDECPRGQQCDAGCGACVEALPDARCAFDAGSRTPICDSRCPAGQQCDADCGRCIPEEGPVAACQRRDGVCEDSCPVGQECNGLCSACQQVEVRQACQPDAAGVCQDSCPDGSQCSADCAGCVAVGILCRKDFRTNLCAGSCPDGFACDDRCVSCVQAPIPQRACQLNRDVCRDDCPEGSVCDADCIECLQR